MQHYRKIQITPVFCVKSTFNLSKTSFMSSSTQRRLSIGVRMQLQLDLPWKGILLYHDMDCRTGSPMETRVQYYVGKIYFNLAYFSLTLSNTPLEWIVSEALQNQLLVLLSLKNFHGCRQVKQNQSTDKFKSVNLRTKLCRVSDNICGPENFDFPAQMSRCGHMQQCTIHLPSVLQTSRIPDRTSERIQCST